MDERTPPSGPTGRVLVVDDDPTVLTLLRQLLDLEGHEVLEAASGEEALARVAEAPPDAVVLDLVMPGMDGVEACRRLKADPGTAPIPVLVLTGETERAARLRAIAAGASDFLTKPLDSQDLLLRVRNAVVAKRAYDDVARSLARQRELEASREALTQVLVHDLRSPLMGIQGSLSLLRTRGGARLEATERRYLDRALASAASLVEMVGAILDVRQLEEGTLPLAREACDLDALVRGVVSGAGTPSGGRQVRVEGGGPLPVDCDGRLVRRVVGHLLDNSLRFSPEGAVVRVEVRRDAAGATVAFVDPGPAVPPGDRTRVFETAAHAEGGPRGRAHGTGLALVFCRLAIQAHGGRIGADAGAEGSRFWFTLPV